MTYIDRLDEPLLEVGTSKRPGPSGPISAPELKPRHRQHIRGRTSAVNVRVVEVTRHSAARTLCRQHDAIFAIEPTSEAVKGCPLALDYPPINSLNG
jgi:hypothetical protein